MLTQPKNTLYVLSLIVCMGFSVVSVQTYAKKYTYRYYENGTQKTSHFLTQKLRKNGYEVLDSNMRVVKKVPPYNAKAIAEKKQQQEEVAKEQKKKFERKRHLSDTYGSSYRAQRKRTEILANHVGERSFAKSQVTVAQEQLKIELDKAASMEKSGKKVSKPIKENIQKKRDALKKAQKRYDALVKRQQAEISKITQHIRELRAFETNK